MRWGKFRWGIYHNRWSDLVQRLEAAGVPSQDVTRRRLTLSSVDSATGWFDKDFSTSTIEMVLIPRASSHLATAVGSYVRTDFLGLCIAGIEEGDEILHTRDGEAIYYEVKAVREIPHGNTLSHREADLTLLPMWT